MDGPVLVLVEGPGFMFRVCGQGFGFTVWDSGFRVRGLGITVYGVGFGV